MIDARDLEVRYGGRGRRAGVHAVRGVSLAVAPGEAFGLVGESGCGKSTALKAMAGLAPASAGSVRVAGLDPARPAGGRRAFARRVQMVFQDPYGSLHPRHAVGAILREPMAIHGLPDPGGRRATGALREVGLDASFLHRFPHQLSGGQRQRVAIARALLLEPELLLLDEPTSALDVSIQAEILNLLADLRRARGLTLLLVSHNLAVVAHLCDRVAVMREGRIVEEAEAAALRGTGAEGLRHPYSRRLRAAAMGYRRDLARDDLEPDDDDAAAAAA